MQVAFVCVNLIVITEQFLPHSPPPQKKRKKESKCEKKNIILSLFKVVLELSPNNVFLKEFLI